MNKRNWKFRVVKRARGMNGAWFDFPTAATFTTQAEACDYARRFAAAQQGVGGVAIDVRMRCGSCGFGRGALVESYRPHGPAKGSAPSP